MNYVSDCSENPFFKVRKKRLKRKARPAPPAGGVGHAQIYYLISVRKKTHYF